MTHLSGRVVATTRDDAPEDPLIVGLRAAGARVVVWRTLRFESTEGLQLPRAPYDWVVFTSSRAVAELAGRDFPVADARIAVVGKGTATAVVESGWRVSLCGTDGAEELARAMIVDGPVNNAHVLFPTSALAGGSIETILSEAGANVDRIHVYRTIPVPPNPETVRFDLAQGVDIVTFASPSAVASLCESLGTDWSSALSDLQVVAIGKTTAESLRRAGVDRVRVTIAPTPSVQGLIDACRRVASTLDRRR